MVAGLWMCRLWLASDRDGGENRVPLKHSDVGIAHSYVDPLALFTSSLPSP